MLSVKVDTSSLKELQGQLGAIKKSLANRATKKALTAMGKIFRDGLKKEIPVRSGLLKKSIAFKVWKPKGKNAQYMAKIGAKNVKGAFLWKDRQTHKHKVTTTQKQFDKASQNERLKKVNWNKKKNNSNSINPAHYLHLVDGGAKAHNIETNFPYGKRNTVRHPGVKRKGIIAKTARHYGSQANAAAVAVLEAEIQKAAMTGKGGALPDG